MMIFFMLASINEVYEGAIESLLSIFKKIKEDLDILIKFLTQRY